MHENRNKLIFVRLSSMFQLADIYVIKKYNNLSVFIYCLEHQNQNKKINENCFRKSNVYEKCYLAPCKVQFSE